MASEMLQMCAVALLLRTICSLREDREFRARNTILLSSYALGAMVAAGEHHYGIAWSFSWIAKVCLCL